MEGRALRILIGMLVGAFVLFWFVRPKRTKVPQVEAGQLLPPGADARVEGIKLLQTGPEGDLALTARDGEWSLDDQRFRLNVVDIRFLSADTGGNARLGGRITSDVGHASTNARDFDLEGRVVAETFDGYRLETSDVKYHHGTRTADTAAPVSLTGPGVNVTGRGATVDYVTQRVEIRGRVRAQLLPKVLEENAPDGLGLPK